MALWKEAQPEATVTPVTRLRPEPTAPAPAPVPASPRELASPREMKETVIASGLTFEGKIEGSGHVRISGRFKGDVHVDGTLTIEAGAHLAGSVRAGSVIIAGEIEGNIESANKVELQQTGVVNGDINAGSLTVASGARMRGRAEFGWTETGGQRLAGRG